MFENLDEEGRQQLEGYRPGLYVRVVFDEVPVEFITHFDATKPYIIGGLLIGEQNIGAVQVICVITVGKVTLFALQLQ